MNQPHQHGPQCSHGHSQSGHGQGNSHNHGHSQGHQGHNHGFQGPSQFSPKQYFDKLKQLKQNTKQFYWMEILSGNAANNYYELKNIQFLKALNCQMIYMIVGSAQMMLNFDWVPLILKPFVNGLFFPLCFLLFFNYNVLFGFDGQANQTPNILFLMYLTVILFALCALRGSGNLNNETNKQLTKQGYQQRIYLQNPQMNCTQCKILKAFRGFHCPVCKTCIPKFTRHSLVFGACIGAANQLLALFFFLSLFYTQTFTLVQFWQLTDYGIITQIMFYGLNVHILWGSLVECCTLFILNIKFGITQFQIRGWMMLQYLLKVPMRQFQNNCNNGIVHNLTQSCYAMINLPGYQALKKSTKPYIPSEQERQSLLDFQNIDQSKLYVVNWSNAFVYLTPQMPNHKRRNQIIQFMKRDQSKMIEMYKLQKKFKEQVLEEVRQKGEQLTEFQIQQKVMMKIQQHMMKNNPQMMQQMSQPSTQQQKMIQLQMLAHMRKQLQSQPQFGQKIQQLQTNLKQGKLTPIEVNLAMRQIQQQIMAKKMKQIMKQKEQMDNKKVQKEEQEQSLKRQEELPDEDL